MALPPAEDIPEEILRTEIILDARSPLDGRPLTAEDYAQLQADLRDVNDWEAVPPETANLIFLLQLRRVIKPVIPFLP